MSENSMLHLLNFHSSKRLHRGIYYRLNVNILSDGLRVSLNENSPLFVGFSYDLRNLAENENGELLETTWFTLDEITRTCEEGVDILSNLPCCRWVNRKIQVNDVGQGNCNEILDSIGNVEIVYDLGASIRAPKTLTGIQMRQWCNGSIGNFTKSKEPIATESSKRISKANSRKESSFLSLFLVGMTQSLSSNATPNS